MIKKIMVLTIFLLLLLPTATALNEDAFSGLKGFVDVLVTSSKLDTLLGTKPADINCVDTVPGYCDDLADIQSQPLHVRMKNIVNYILPTFLDFQKQESEADKNTREEELRIQFIKDNLREKTRDVWSYTNGILLLVLDLLTSMFYIAIMSITIFILIVFLPTIFIRMRNLLTNSIVGSLQKQRKRSK